MTCRDCKDLMMAYLDNEVNETDKRNFEEHLASCVQCAREMAEFKRLKRVTDGVALAGRRIASGTSTGGTSTTGSSGASGG